MFETCRRHQELN